MSDKKEELNKFKMGFVGDKNDPEIFVIEVPIKEYLKQGPDGQDMFVGKMRRAEAVGVRYMNAVWAKKQEQSGLSKGVILPNGKPAQVQ